MRTIRLALAVVALVFSACATLSPNAFPDARDGGADDGAVDDGYIAFQGDSGGDSNFSPTFGCSADLHDVVDGNGVVQQQCLPKQGCSAGKCVAACDAAGQSKGSVGCDYVIATPGFFTDIRSPCFAVFLANSWSMDAPITVQRLGKSYSVSSFGRIAEVGTPATSWAPVPPTGLPPGKVAVLFMSDDPSSANGGPLTCPISPAIRQSFGAAVPGLGNVTGRGAAWHITTGLPVTAYDIIPYGGATSYLPSAELLIPTTAWGTNYFGIVPWRGSSSPQWGQILASQDNTIVTVRPPQTLALPSGTNVVGAPAGIPTKYSLNAGEFIQWEDTMEMSGTIIQSSNPIAFMGGQGYACYWGKTSKGGGCDSAHQQIMPISSFGSQYVIPPYFTRRADNLDESIPYRFVGAVNGTLLKYTPSIASAPDTLQQGQVYNFETTEAFVVKAQDNDHPFYVGQMMTGFDVTSGSKNGGSLGDEEYVNILPPAQFMKNYVFFTDPTYATTNLVVTRVKTAQGFQDVTLDCAGALSGWKPVGSSEYEITNIDLVRDGTPNGKCDNGPHQASSSGPFGIMVWGLDGASSYAYPAGGSFAPINKIVVPTIPN